MAACLYHGKIQSDATYGQTKVPLASSSVGIPRVRQLNICLSWINEDLHALSLYPSAAGNVMQGLECNVLLHDWTSMCSVCSTSHHQQTSMCSVCSTNSGNEPGSSKWARAEYVGSCHSIVDILLHICTNLIYYAAKYLLPSQRHITVVVVFFSKTISRLL